MDHVCPHWLSFILDNPIRRRFTDRTEIVRQLSAQQGDTILEMGCGNAFFTRHLLVAAPDVKVVTADLQLEMVCKTQKKLGRDQISRVLPLIADAGAIGLADNSAQRIFLYFVFHEVKEKAAAANELYRVLSPGGMLGLWEPKMEVSRPLMEQFCRMFTDAGLVTRERKDSKLSRFALFEKRSN